MRTPASLVLLALTACGASEPAVVVPSAGNAPAEVASASPPPPGVPVSTVEAPTDHPVPEGRPPPAGLPPTHPPKLPNPYPPGLLPPGVTPPPLPQLGPNLCASIQIVCQHLHGAGAHADPRGCASLLKQMYNATKCP
jgi:hypothetical protein